MSSTSDATPAQLAIVLAIAVGFFVTLWILMAKAVPEGNKDALEIMLGVLGTQFANVVLHYFRPAPGAASGPNGGTSAGGTSATSTT